LAVNPDLLGHLLYEKYLDHTIEVSEIRLTAIETAAAAIKDRCEVPYQFVLIPGRLVPFPVQQIPLAGRDSILLYALGETSMDQVILGRHYRVELSPDGGTVRSVVPSTKDCVIISTASLSGASAIDHQLSRGPTEFHVFLSLLHRTKFRVRTALGVWSIDDGTVDLIAADSNYEPAKSTLVDCNMPGGWKLTTTEAACRSNGGAILN
jgi:hypothetical protein